ncbi:MAG: DnaJ domain-containing protein [bacterium]|nr:DnaJ domain-containing protein [bacterium]
MSTAIDPLEIEALARIMDELDYYQLLGVAPQATSAEIRKAYHASSRSFHPDANRTLPDDLRATCGQISKRITEAYCVLRDARRRKAYDSKRDENDSASTLRIQIAEAKNAHVEARKSECRGATAQGRQFHAKAEADIKSGNFAGAIQNLQMALTFEPANAGFKALVDDLKEKQKAGN